MVLAKYFYKLFIVIIAIIILVGCQNNKDEAHLKEIHYHLEETALLENSFEDVQDPLLKAEEEEQRLYEQIIKLPLSEMDLINNLSSRAIQSAELRTDLIEQEMESINKAYEEFQLIKPIIEKLNDEAIKEFGNDLVSNMDARYVGYHNLNKVYSEGIKLDIKLYEMLTNEKMSINELEAHIETLNEQYEKIIKKQEEFNSTTEIYNKSKKDFYEAAGFEIEKNNGN